MIREIVPVEEIRFKAHSIGQYYGFMPLTSLTVQHRGVAQPKSDRPESAPADFVLDQAGETVASFLRRCQSAGCAPSSRQPLFIWHSNIAPGRPAPKRVTLQFHALGSDRAIADTVVIRALLALSRDLFRETPTVHVNSMGDKETRARWARELGAFFRRRASVLPEDLLESARRDVFEAAELAIARGLADDLPSPIEHLSDASRKRFEELLDYLEATETPYELSRHLMSRSNGWNDVCFEFTAGGQRVGWGSRYSDLTRYAFSSGPFPATGAILYVTTAPGAAEALRAERGRGRIRFSFVHIGDEAKRFSIRLAEDFRKAHVPLTQYIGVESLAEQIHLAERQDSPYLLVMGRKEALDGSVILRDRRTQEETVLPVSGLAERLRTFA